MNEATLTKKLVKDLGLVMPGSVTIKTNDSVTLGIPDLIHCWSMNACWIEVKYLAPDCTVFETQKEMMRRLGRAVLAFWVEFHNHDKQQYTVIKHHDYHLICEMQPGFNTMYVANFVRERMLRGL